MTLSHSKSTLPVVDVPTGTAVSPDEETPTLFTPIKIRGLELQNRFVVSPMGTWSAQDGHLTEFYLMHLGSFAFRGVPLTIVESTAVAANGRTSPQDSGLWQDSQIEPLKRVADFVHGQGQKIGIQLNHAGVKAGMIAPRFLPKGELKVATKQDGGWPDNVWGPSAIPHTEAHVMPGSLNLEGIEALIQSFADAARRAIKAGLDFIEIHGAHGYLINQFLSPLTNKRTDEYGGSFENRVRFLVRVIKGIRAVIPDSVPLSLRISAIEWMEWSGEPSWDLDQSIRLAKLLPALGVDILDVSSGGNHKDQKIDVHPNYQLDLARTIRAVLREERLDLLVAAMGFIHTPQTAHDVVQLDKEDGVQADLAFVGRQFLKEPEFVLKTAQELGVEIQWPYQYDMIGLNTHWGRSFF
ncbi:Oxidored-FMN domain-containing protein [Fusarium keratoplasticum]|nr:Oxidored-FMN domain-containing protein [Fusarium keratoplasticum]